MLGLLLTLGLRLCVSLPKSPLGSPAHITPDRQCSGGQVGWNMLPRSGPGLAQVREVHRGAGPAGLA